MPKILKTTYMDFYPANQNKVVMRVVVNERGAYICHEPVKRPVYDSCDLFVGV